MTRPAVCESLETRSHFAASATLDPTYLFSAPALKKVAGPNVEVIQAVPGRGDRTYLLAERYSGKRTTNGGRLGTLTIVAVNAQGQLDTTFNGDGVTLTGRVIERRYVGAPGILKVDGAGRLYFADNSRVLRFRANGATDSTFGVKGAIEYASKKRPGYLCDFVVNDDGSIFVASTQTIDGVVRVAVQKIARRVQTIWETNDDIGSGETDEAKYQTIAPDIAQFAQSPGGTALAHFDADYKRYPDMSADAGPGATFLGVRHQTMTITTFSTQGVARDLGKLEVRVANHQATNLCSNDDRYPNVNSVLLSPNGQSLTAVTDQELLRFNLHTGTAKRTPLPGNFARNTVAYNARYQLFPDGSFGVLVGNYDGKGRAFTEINKLLPDGTSDTAFGNNGQVIVTRTDYSTGRENVIDQLFAGSSGRVYFLTTGTVVGSPDNLTLRRV